MFFSYGAKKTTAELKSKNAYLTSITSISNVNQIIHKIIKYQKFICQYSLRVRNRYWQKNCRKRTFYAPSAYENYLKRASLTVEAAMVFPIFLLFFYLLLYGGKIIELQSKIQYALDTTAVEFANYAAVKDGNNSQVQDIAGSIVYSKAGALVLFEKNLKKCKADTGMLLNAALPFSFRNSQILSSEKDIYLQVNYRIRFPGTFIGSGLFSTGIPCVQNVCVRAFVGASSRELWDNEMVYIATGEQVYHTSGTCTYLALSIKRVSVREFETAPQYYKKYKSCARCKSQIEGDIYYITEDGTRYHKTILCKSLKRTVERIPRNQVGTRRMCSRCSKRSGG